MWKVDGLRHKISHHTTLAFSLQNISQILPPMSAKSPGTLPMIYAVDELQNPLPRKTMLFEGDTNSTGGINDVFPSS